MKDINKFFLLFVILFGMMSMPAFSQEEEIMDYKPGQLKSFGRNAMLQGDYSSGAMYYESYMVQRPSNYKIAYKLAECYRLSKDFRKAEAAYLKAYELQPEKNALALFHYATMLKITGRYRQADEYYAKFRKEYKGKDKQTYLKLIKNNAKAAEYVEQVINNPAKAAVTRMDTTINTNLVESSPVFVNDSTLIYASIKTNIKYYHFNPEDSSSNEPLRKMYVAKRYDDTWKDAGEYYGPFSSETEHVSNGAFSPNGKQFYFTRCKRNNKNRMICAIYVSNLENGTWEEPVMLGNGINDPQFTSTQPAIGIDLVKNREIIYFVSDREGGKGGMDIWYTTYDARKKEYKTPLNAGAKINTPGDEVTPFFDPFSKTLYFSSDGWQGIGGLDVFKTFGEYKKWTTPENMGSPLNSSFDDLYYIVHGTKTESAILVSNRESEGTLGVMPSDLKDLPDSLNTTSVSKGCCDDLFTVQWLDAINLNIAGKLLEQDENGNSISKVPVKGAKILLEQKNASDTSFIAVNGNFTDDKGNFTLSLMPDREYRLIAKKDGYLSTVYDFNTIGKRKSENLDVEMGVKPAPLDAIGLQNIYYEYGKSTLTEDAMKAIDTTLLVILTNNPDMVVELSSHTDNIGSDAANMKLSQNRAESVVNYLISKGINGKAIIPKGYGESKPIASNQNDDGSDNPEGRQKNRRTEFKIVGKLMEDGRIRNRTTF